MSDNSQPNGHPMSDSGNSVIPLAAEQANKPNAMRDRIAATLKARWPAPWFGGEGQNKQIQDLTDALLVELDLGIPCHQTGCRMRQIARRHTQGSGELAGTGDTE